MIVIPERPVNDRSFFMRQKGDICKCMIKKDIETEKERECEYELFAYTAHGAIGEC